MSGAAILVFLAEVAILLGLCLLSDLVTQLLSLWDCLMTFMPEWQSLVSVQLVQPPRHVQAWQM